MAENPEEPKYNDDNERMESESHPLVSDEIDTRYQRRSSRRNYCSWLWMFSTMFFAMLSMKLAFFPNRSSQHNNCWERGVGFETDLEAARISSDYEVVTFTGGVEEDENGRLYRVEDGPANYVGPPSPAIDDAWHELQRGIEVILYGDEAKSVANRTTEEPEGGWRVTVDVFHSLHCVDELRRTLDPEYYFPEGMGSQPYFYRDHLYHCVDYLRQVVQCQGDLTPLRYVWSETHATGKPLWGEPHTCRNFKMIQDWARARAAF